MTKYFITYDKERAFYSYTTDNNEILVKPLDKEDIKILFYDIENIEIANTIEIGDNTLEIIFKNGLYIVINDIRVFKYEKNDETDRCISKLHKKLIEYSEKKSISEYKEKLPKEYKLKVNRNRRKNNKAIATGLAVIMLSMSVHELGLVDSILTEKANADYVPDDKEINMNLAEEELPKAEINIEYASSYENNQDYEYIKSNNNYLDVESTDYINNGINLIAKDAESDLLLINKKQQNNIKTENGIPVYLAFEDHTETGKLEQTIEDCAPYVDKYIERYGLPRDLTYALLSLEYGILDCTIQPNGGCGPMQIQVSAQHTETYRVPVYKNGVPTGEYDTFVAADGRHLGDSRLVGKNVKVIQNLEDNFQIGCAYFRRCIDKYKNIFIALDAYNKGLYAMEQVYNKVGERLPNTIEYYKENFDDFSWTSIIPENSLEVFNQATYGGPNYIWDVLKHLETGDRGLATIEYYYEGELITVDLTNTNVYNSELSR